MAKRQPRWRKYQHSAAKLFRSLECTVEVDKQIEGARGRHNVDVWVAFRRLGFTIRWVIECKCWNTAVPKEKVLALQAIVADVGADRGVLISDRGFQSGAIRCSTHTNISLTSLQELEQTVQEEIVQATIRALETKSTALKYGLMGLRKTESLGRGHGISRPLPGTDANLVLRTVGALSMLQFGFERVRLQQLPYLCPASGDGDTMLASETLAAFADNAAAIVADATNVLTAQQRAAREHI